VGDIIIRCPLIHLLSLFALVSLRLVEFHQILNVFLATEEDWATFMDVVRLNVKDPLGSCGGKTPSLLGEVGHREGFVEKPKFSIFALLVIGVTENATVQQRSVNVGNHGPDIPSRVRRLARRRELDRVEIIGHWWIEVNRVSFVEGIDFPSRWNLDIRVRKDEFTKTWIESVSVHRSLSREPGLPKNRTCNSQLRPFGCLV